jgi:hypothetical protein
MDSEDSRHVLDGDLEYELWLDHQEELADRPPAVWWDDHLSDIGPRRAEQAEAALRRITGKGCPHVVALEALRVVSDYKAHPPTTRHVLLAHADHVRPLIDAAETVANDLVFYRAADELTRAIRTVCASGPGYLADLRADADKLRRNRDTVMNGAIFTLLRAVARATGKRHYRDVHVLLGAVGVNRSEDALKVLAFRARGGLSLPPAKPAKPPSKPRGRRGRPRNPNVIRKKGPREITVGTAADLDAVLASRSRQSPRPERR